MVASGIRVVVMVLRTATLCRLIMVLGLPMTLVRLSLRAVLFGALMMMCWLSVRVIKLIERVFM